MNPMPVRITFDEGRLVADRRQPPASRVRRGDVLLLHGGGQTRHSWAAAADAIAERGWTVYSLDSRGHGESQWNPEGDYSLDALIGDLRVVVGELGERPVVVGASMGGMTGLVGQGEHWDLARALVLVDIVPRVNQDGIGRIVAFMESSVGGFDTLEEATDAVRAYSPNRVRRPSVEGLHRIFRRGQDRRWYWHWDPAMLGLGGGHDSDSAYRRMTAAARHIDVPTMVVRGGRSDVVDEEGVREVLTLIPHAHLADVVGAGHMVAGDDNDAFTASVLGFLDALPED